jgi:hypothetical protein
MPLLAQSGGLSLIDGEGINFILKSEIGFILTYFFSICRALVGAYAAFRESLMAKKFRK